MPNDLTPEALAEGEQLMKLKNQTWDYWEWKRLASRIEVWLYNNAVSLLAAARRDVERRGEHD